MFKSLKTPINFGFLLTLLMVFLLSSYLFSTKYSEYKLYQQAEEALPFSTQIEHLIGSLAEERGLHDLKQSKHIANSDIQYLAQQLSAARAHTDTIIHSSQILKKLQTQYPKFKHLADSLRQLPNFRQSKESFQAYTFIILQLIDFHTQVLNQAIFPLSNIHLIVDLDNLNVLLQLREYTGQERGLMMQVLLSRSLDTDHYFKLSGIIQLQQLAINDLQTSPIHTEDDPIIQDRETLSLNLLKQELASNKYTEFTSIRQQIKNQFHLQQQLVKLLTTVGYTGFIHHYKNYVLRYQPIYYQQAKLKYSSLKKLLNHLLMALPLTEQQKKDIQILKQTFEQYNKNLDKIKQMFAKGLNTSTVDALIKVDDSVAKAAIEDLQHFYTSIPPKVWWSQATQRIHSIDKTLNFFKLNIKTEIQDYKRALLLQAYLLLGGLLTLIFFIALITRYVFKRIQQLIHLSNSLNKMSKDRNFLSLPINGKDEIASLSTSFNNLIREREQYEHELWERSNLDPLTQLPNRSYLQELLALFIRDCKRQKNKLGVLFIDLDGFKNINDTKGHHIGDQLLQAVANLLKSSIRSSDIAARLGGDEFIILLPNLKKTENLESIAQKIIQTLSEPIEITTGLTVKVSASIGITLYPKDADNASDLLMNADLAMYEAKAQGKNRFAFYQQNLSHNLTFEQQISDALTKAVGSGHPEKHGFFLTYQPIVDASSQKLEHFEALIRWIHPVLGSLSPEKFIDIAEKTHTIIPLGEWIIREAALQLTQWQKAFKQTLHISINLSPVQSENGFASVHQVLERLQNQNFPVEALHFEITESLLMQNSLMIRNGLEVIRSYGCKIYLDDFGTGYSSLSYLKLFALDVLKIDRSFIMELMEDTQDQELVNTILSIAKVLNMQVVAEGVEAQEQFDYLKAHDCDFIQGYLISKPLTGDEAIAFIQKI